MLLKGFWLEAAAGNVQFAWIAAQQKQTAFRALVAQQMGVHKWCCLIVDGDRWACNQGMIHSQFVCSIQLLCWGAAAVTKFDCAHVAFSVIEEQTCMFPVAQQPYRLEQLQINFSLAFLQQPSALDLQYFLYRSLTSQLHWVFKDPHVGQRPVLHKQWKS